MKKLKPVAQSERGQSLVEMAISLVVLLVLLAGIVDLGRAIFTWMTMRDAAEEGVVYASIYPSPCSRIRSRVNQAMNTSITPIIDIQINGMVCEAASPTTDACAGKEVEVTVIEPEFPITMPFLGSVLGRQTIELKARVSGTMLRPACSP